MSKCLADLQGQTFVMLILMLIQSRSLARQGYFQCRAYGIRQSAFRLDQLDLNAPRGDDEMWLHQLHSMLGELLPLIRCRRIRRSPRIWVRV